MPHNSREHPEVSLGMIQAYSSPIGYENSRNDHNLLHHSSHSDQRCPVPSPSKVERKLENPSTSVNGGDDGKHDTGSSDAAEVDKKETDDDDEDDNAPFDSAIILGDNQAGHTYRKVPAVPAAVGQKRKRDVVAQAAEALAATEAEAAKRTRKTREIEESSDADDYDGVDLISDSEEVDCSVEELEEKLIIASEEGMRLDSMGPLNWTPDGWDGLDLDPAYFLPDHFCFEEQHNQMNPNTLVTEAELYVHDNTLPPLISDGRRRVRFADPVSLPHDFSSDEVSESSRDMPMNSSRWKDEWPSTGRGTVGEGIKNARRLPSQRPMSFNFNEKSESSCGNSSGYETDLGETTEEDDISPSRSQPVVRRPSESAPRQERSKASAPLHRPSQKGHRPGPLMGSWVADPTKPIAWIDKTGTSLIVLRASRPAKTNKRTLDPVASGTSTVKTSPRMPRPSFSSDVGYSPDYSEPDRSELSTQEYETHHARLAKPTVVAPQLLHRNSGFAASRHHLRDKDIESPATFLPMNSSFFFDQFYESDENGGDIPLDINDFVDFGDDSEDSGDDKKYSAATTTDQSPLKPRQAQSWPIEAQSQNFLEHLGKGVVTAFRRDQYRHATLLPLYMEDDILDPIDFATMHATASAPLSPVRERQMSEGPNYAENINQARAALAALSR